MGTLREARATIARRPASVKTGDGWTLAGDAIEPEGRPRAVVVLTHAMMATRATLDRPAGAGLVSTLAARGLAVLSFDLRGHGESAPTPRQGGSYRYDDFIHGDVPALVAHARAAYSGLPVGFVGHSLGAHTALVAAGLDPARAPDALVLLAANVWLPDLEPSFVRRLVKAATLRAWLAVTPRGGFFEARRYGLGGETVSRAFIEQFAAFWSSGRYGSVDGSTDYFAAMEKVRVPVLSVTSEGDSLLAHPACVDRFLDRMRGARVDRRLVRRGELGGWTPGHMELVTDARSRPVWEHVASWLERVLLA